MSNLIKKWYPVFLGLLIGVIATYAVLTNHPHSMDNSSADKPLYWVAPMDPNFKRDKPGLSPMGMELVPVFDNKTIDSVDSDKGVVLISPEVINNFGVRTSMAEIRSIESKIKTVGYVKYDEDQLVHIHPRVEGWIEKLHVKAAGEPVTQGEPLYQIYSPALVNAQEELQIAIERKNKRLIQAAEDRLSAMQLPSEVITQLKKTRKIQQTVTFSAPQNGVVDNLNIREGFFVKPGTTIMSIGQLTSVWVEAEIFERQSSLVKQGAPVSMSLDYVPGVVWQGEVDYVYPTLDPATRTTKVRLRFANEDNQLKPNMFAQVIIYPDSGKKALLIPREAVIRSGSSNRVVLALGEGRFKSINVKLGRFDESFIEILEGIEEGDLVVTSAQFLVDSESSKNSDFLRMHHPVNSKESESSSQEKASAIGVINQITPEHRLLNISRGAIAKWNRPAATLDFVVDEAIDLEALKEGMRVQFIFRLEQGEFIISEIQQDEREDESEKNGSEKNESGKNEPKKSTTSLEKSK